MLVQLHQHERFNKAPFEFFRRKTRDDMHVYSTPLMSHLTHDDKQSEKCACFYVWMGSHVRLSKREMEEHPGGNSLGTSRRIFRV